MTGQNTGSSIHPRVVNGRTLHEKVNTSAKPNKAVAERKIAAIKAHLESHPRDGLSRQHLDALNGKAMQ